MVHAPAVGPIAFVRGVRSRGFLDFAGDLWRKHGDVFEAHVGPRRLVFVMESAAEGWLREADAFCSAAGERALQRLVRRTLASVGAKVPKGSTSAVPPHLARLGITARETEILRLVNAGLSNADISHRLFISTRTVESHVSSMAPRLTSAMSVSTVSPAAVQDHSSRARRTAPGDPNSASARGNAPAATSCRTKSPGTFARSATSWIRSDTRAPASCHFIPYSFVIHCYPNPDAESCTIQWFFGCCRCCASHQPFGFRTRVSTSSVIDL